MNNFLRIPLLGLAILSISCGTPNQHSFVQLQSSDAQLDIVTIQASAIAYLQQTKPEWSIEEVQFWKLKGFGIGAGTDPASSFYAFYGYYKQQDQRFIVKFDVGLQPVSINGVMPTSVRETAPWGDAEFYTLGHVSIATKDLADDEISAAVSALPAEHQVQLPIKPEEIGDFTFIYLTVGDFEVLPTIDALSKVEGFFEVWPDRIWIPVSGAVGIQETTFWQSAEVAVGDDGEPFSKP